MDGINPVLMFAGAIVLAIIARLVAGSFDGTRIADHINSLGGTILDRSWDPFGPGWYGEESNRIYEIRYRDRDGSIHKAHVKTSMWSGVYLTNDRIIEKARPKKKPKSLAALPLVTDLAAENARLRAKLRKLEEKV